MQQYHDLLKHILENGQEREDRTGTGTLSVFGYQTRYNLEEGFPLVTTKKIFWGGIVDELLWFLNPQSPQNFLTTPRLNLFDLPKRSHNMWRHWAKPDGDLGRMYGAQWRAWSPGPYPWGTIDQIAKAIDTIKTNPTDRGIIISAWNVSDLNDMQLRPCHTMFQFYVQNNKLSCQLYQRSCDAFLGLPFNIGSYALLTHLIAQVTGLGVGEFVHTFGDLHIYKNHIDQVNLQLTRDLRPLPKLILNPAIKNIDKFNICDIHIEGYEPHPAIKGEVAV